MIDDRLRDLLEPMARLDASDLHIVPGHRPTYRIHGDLTAASELVISPEETLQLVESIIPKRLEEAMSQRLDCDFAMQLDDDAERPMRFRVNVATSRNAVGACFRAIPNEIPTLPELGFPGDLGARIINQRDGLVLITGITGSGKTTTLASLIQMLNTAGGRRIITIEEPIEYIYAPIGSSIITQREVGMDVPSFYEGLRSGLRQDPDVLLVGEIRDRETAQLAISAAETGHLIFATMHTRDAKSAITRLIDIFPAERNEEIRAQLAMSLRFAIAQYLLPSVIGGRRVLALESMYGSFGVRSAIRQGRFETLDTAIQGGRADGMFTLDTDLSRLVADNRISMDTARAYAHDPSEFGGQMKY
ncbi:MAG TPA: PilT/PilU family type 4a pilus ATPase [Phycisphaerae bacterium]|mgnify:CR=1 FL=1|nr:PilT/PilU family type 4a pilus ATPase [Phycisphaerae bacterium]HRW54062.1 PilT/PilU family type 4a pilus ATPase [Phycisphaerae bacterium]